MEETVYKIEQNDELVDVMRMRIVEKDEIEIFALTQALGLLELIERRMIVTSQCKKSVLSYHTSQALKQMGSEPEVVQVFVRGMEMQGETLSVTDAVVDTAKELKEEVLRLLDVRLQKQIQKKREWLELYKLDEKTLKAMHDLSIKNLRERVLRGEIEVSNRDELLREE